jgi:hypothetical protein
MAWSISKVRQLFADDPIRLQTALGKPDIEALAREVVAHIEAEVEGDRDDPATWLRAAKRLGVKSIYKLSAGQGPGYYVWRDREIYYNPHADDDTVCRRIIHELAHHIQAWRKIGRIRQGLERYDGTRKTVQHQVAVHSELLLKGERKAI